MADIPQLYMNDKTKLYPDGSPVASRKPPAGLPGLPSGIDAPAVDSAAPQNAQPSGAPQVPGLAPGVARYSSPGMSGQQPQIYFSRDANGTPTFSSDAAFSAQHSAGKPLTEQDYNFQRTASGRPSNPTNERAYPNSWTANDLQPASGPGGAQAMARARFQASGPGGGQAYAAPSLTGSNGKPLTLDQFKTIQNPQQRAELLAQLDQRDPHANPDVEASNKALVDQMRQFHRGGGDYNPAGYGLPPGFGPGGIPAGVDPVSYIHTLQQGQHMQAGDNLKTAEFNSGQREKFEKQFADETDQYMAQNKGASRGAAALSLLPEKFKQNPNFLRTRDGKLALAELAHSIEGETNPGAVRSAVTGAPIQHLTRRNLIGSGPNSVSFERTPGLFGRQAVIGSPAYQGSGGPERTHNWPVFGNNGAGFLKYGDILDHLKGLDPSDELGNE